MIVEENLKSVAASDTTKLTEAEASTDKPTDTTPPVNSDSVSSAVRSRKRKAILLPDDYHSKVAATKVENGMLEQVL